MSYKPAPPTRYTEPTLLRGGERPSRVWGDAESGQVLDTIYVSNDTVHLVKFSVPPGGGWRDSGTYKTFFAADVVYLVISGELFVADVETGEVQQVVEGEALHVPPQTWHHGFNHGDTSLEMIEFIAPPPATGTTRDFYRDIPLPPAFRYAEERGDGATSSSRMRRSRRDDLVWWLEGPNADLLVGVLAKTPNLLVALGRLPARRASGQRSHAGGLVLLVLEGALVIEVEKPERAWWPMHPGDGFFVPADHPYELRNVGDRSCTFVFEAAPEYRSS